MIDFYIYFLNTTRAEDSAYLKTLSEQFISAGYSESDASNKAIYKAVQETKARGGIGNMLQYIEENFHAEGAS